MLFISKGSVHANSDRYDPLRLYVEDCHRDRQGILELARRLLPSRWGPTLAYRAQVL